MGHEASHLPSERRSSAKFAKTKPDSTIVRLKPQTSYSQPSNSMNKSAQSPITTPATSIARNESSIFEEKTDTITSKSIKTNKINNGVTGEYISVTTAETAYIFWKQNIDNLSREDQLEIGCSICFTMMGSSKEMKRILWQNIKTDDKKNKLKRFGFQFLDMMGWLIRYLLVNNINLKATMMQLGIGHKALGINISHFKPMLSAIHETFAYYFEYKYSIKEKYAIDKLFMVSAELMMGQDIHSVRIMGEFAKSFHDLDFLKSLSVCLNSEIGKEYLYRYLEQTFCDELVIYLQSIRRYEAAVSDKEKFMIVRDICKTSIKPTAPFCINISYEARHQTMNAILELESRFFSPLSSKNFKVPSGLFGQCNREVIRLIEQNHWNKFKAKIIVLSDSS